jgi:hypothetical protein
MGENEQDVDWPMCGCDQLEIPVRLEQTGASDLDPTGGGVGGP